MNQAIIDADVVVVGAGPVGLLLACELRRAGVQVVVIDRLPAPMTESRASQLSALSAELLYERGYDALLVEAEPERTAHFAGLPFSLAGVASPFGGLWKVPQHRTEAIFAERAVAMGAGLLREFELTRITQHVDHVVCEVEGPHGGIFTRSQYVVACDGADSTVRRVARFPLTATEPTRELLRADVKGLEVRDRRFERLGRGFAVASTRRGVTRLMVHVFGDAVAPRVAPPDFAEVVRAWECVTGEDVAMGEPVWVDAFDNSTGHVDQYRIGRVFVAGDAAHWHLPIGGQALNLGLQDAVNLGWKLAGAVHGWAADDLLDSYGAERHPVVARAISQVAAQELLLLGGRDVEPLRSVLAEIIDLDQARLHFAMSASNLAPGHRLTGESPVGERVPNLGPPLKPTVVHRTRAGVGSGFATSSLLVRPDGYVAWAGEQGMDEALNKLMRNGR